MSLGLDRAWRREAVRKLDIASGMKVLDVGCGPGEMLELMPPGVVRIGLDPEIKMLRQGGDSSFRIIGMGEELPLKGGKVERVVSAFVLRNVSDRRAAFREVERVLARGGKGALIDFSPPHRSPLGLVVSLYVRYGIPLVGGVISGDPDAYRYLSRTILDFPSPEIVAGELVATGLEGVNWRRLGGGVAVLYTFRKRDGE